MYLLKILLHINMFFILFLLV